MDLQLQNSVCFVAGSSRGIGRAIATTLLAEGASIVLTGRNQDSLDRTHADLATPETQTRILSIPADFTDPRAIQTAFDRTIQHFGHIDHLIANLGTGAGTPGPTPPPEDWTRLFDQNFFASVRLTEACLPHLRVNGGSILYISSIVALEATPAPLPYSAAKAALTNYAKNLSRHLAADKIRINTIAPGNIFFPGGSWERHLANRREAVEAMLKTEVPQNRFGTPEEIASLAAWLCSPLAAFSTGSTYVVDGGQTRSI
ncbi:SDR family NAD(P)-dependent oxidoreductase [Granulicella sibirica]|uniref:3-oxoacyl-[acyl-carrier protein] reductase n=1 Tax=Granulicella sibirica TaxID=2479048 RepID=A0A4Q0T003_9BACT|nr:SDR family oxidoreductase [Granulicella sibirica]RXH56497.1 3-oxoacyl-[acyl-carrier protein] reductase [Granulicella sibirica]